MKEGDWQNARVAQKPECHLPDRPVGQERAELQEERARRLRILARQLREEGRLDWEAVLCDFSEGFLACCQCEEVIDLSKKSEVAAWFRGGRWICSRCAGPIRRGRNNRAIAD